MLPSEQLEKRQENVIRKVCLLRVVPPGGMQWGLVKKEQPVSLQGGKNAKQDPAYGADVLRLWVASVDYNSDVLIGGRILSQVSFDH